MTLNIKILLTILIYYFLKLSAFLQKKPFFINYDKKYPLNFDKFIKNDLIYVNY